MAASEAHTVVIIDDVPEIREIVGFLLEESGWFAVVGQASTAEEALEVVARVEPELILLDLELAGSASTDLLATLTERFPTVPVVVLTASADEPALRVANVSSLASAVIDKGTSNRQLIPRLLQVVGESGGHRPEDDRVAAPPAAGPAIDPRHAHAWLAAIVAASPDPIIGLTTDATIISWNPAAELLYGYSPDEIVGRSLAVLVPPDRPRELERILEAIRAGTLLRGYETVRVHKNGSRIDVHLTVTPVTAESGEVIGASTIARDVSTRRHTEVALGRAITQLDRRNRELARSNEELDNFAAVASHDLAQPLQVAYGYLDMVRADFAELLPASGQEWLANSLASLERMRDLVRDILRFARSGTGTYEPTPVDMDAVVDQAMAALATAIDSRGARVDVQSPLPAVVGDAGQLASVMQNLIANAVKFVPADRTPVVAVSGETAVGHVVIRVADNGIGIPEEERGRVFEMFHRAAGPDYRGTGLGLAIVHKVVTRHGGRVWIEDAVPSGTCVVLSLPGVEASAVGGGT